MGDDIDCPRQDEGYIGSEEECSQREKRDNDRNDRFRDRRDRRDFEEIAQEFAKENETTVQKLRERGREQPEAKARQKAMARMDEEGYGPTEIGGYFKRSKGTVANAVKKFGSD
jgi:chromosomal replication initiation ATPase DnaA